MASEAEFSTHEAPWCVNKAWWSASSAYAAEDEVIEFLRGLARAVKPEIAVETGTYHGGTAVAISEALQQNGVGHLYTYEIDAERAAVATLALVDKPATVIQGSLTCTPMPFSRVDFAFLDSSHESRPHEAEVLLPLLSAHAIVAVHDTHPGSAYYEYYLTNFTRIFIRNPRGLVLLQAK